MSLADYGYLLRRQENTLGSCLAELQAISAGTINISAGTMVVSVGTISTLNSGTLNTLNAGTLQYIGNIGTLPLEQDDIDKALATIDLAHHEIHEGKYFSANQGIQAIGTVSNFLLTTPAGGTEYHVQFEVECTDATLVEFYENPTVTHPGNAITIYNKNRQNSGTSVCVASAFTGTFGTVTADGTLLLKHVFGTGGKTSIGGAVRENAEWILKQNMTYHIKAISTANGTLAFTAEWYEVA